MSWQVSVLAVVVLGISLLAAERISSSLLVGLFRPRILLPASAVTSAGAEELRPLFLFFEAAETGSDGKAQLVLPPDARARHIMALRRGVGFDYFGNSGSSRSGLLGTEALPRAVAMTLGPSVRAVIRAENPHGRPVEGARLELWYLTKQGKGLVEVGGGADTVPEIRSTTHTPLASPHQGVLVQAEGMGKRPPACRVVGRSKLDGSFELLLAPDQSYIVAVRSDEWAASSRTGILITEAVPPPQETELTLSEGTLVKGRATSGGKPVAGAAVTVIQTGDPAADAIEIKTTITPLEGGWARLECFSGKGGMGRRWGGRVQRPSRLPSG